LSIDLIDNIKTSVKQKIGKRIEKIEKRKEERDTVFSLLFPLSSFLLALSSPLRGGSRWGLFLDPLPTSP
jgi:hypothetical protein